MLRIYQPIIRQHLAKFQKMVFLTGPRQIGKTVLSQACTAGYPNVLYLNWDNIQHKEMILSGIEKIFSQFSTDALQTESRPPIIIFDEIHKYANWKNLLKGYYDTIKAHCQIIVTGSAKLNVYRRGGDSMLGRYFLYRIHPLTVAEIAGRDDFKQETIAPKSISTQDWTNLLHYGGFPEPYLQADDNFYQRWSNLKQEQIFQEDLRELSKIHDLSRLELLAYLLTQQVGSTTKYSELAKKARVTEPTIRHWIEILRNVYYCFSITPWSQNLSRSLLKEPKIYLWDWSALRDPGARLENLVASHLHKAIHFWTDIGLGKYSLHYLRDKDKHEVDFLVTKNQVPWLMVEVKSSDNTRLSPNLEHFNRQLKVPHVLQVAERLPFVNHDCFELKKPMIVPLQTLLGQLV
ncbi:MAG: ATP-binding protein [Gammaproteobacteria bacterium]